MKKECTSKILSLSESSRQPEKTGQGIKKIWWGIFLRSIWSFSHVVTMRFIYTISHFQLSMSLGGKLGTKKGKGKTFNGCLRLNFSVSYKIYQIFKSKFHSPIKTLSKFLELIRSVDSRSKTCIRTFLDKPVILR